MCARLVGDVSQWFVIDPACGEGNLLLAIVERMQEANVADIHRRIIGIDIDPNMAATARVRLAQAISCHPEQVQIICDDFFELAGNPLLFSEIFTEVTVVISNPPYGQGREYEFLTVCNELFARGTELVFLMPLAFLDRLPEASAGVLDGKPMGVTTGHCIYHHVCGHQLNLQSTHRRRTRDTAFSVLSGVKLYELGAGTPPQDHRLISEKPYSSPSPKPGWLPCLRTGDVEPFRPRLGRLFVNYGPHLAHPKEIGRFTGPRLFVRRMPLWGSRLLCSAYTDETALCAGDVLVVKHISSDVELLRGLCAFINSQKAANAILKHRPSVQHRVSYPKISGKDLEWLFENELPDEDELRRLAMSHETFVKPLKPSKMSGVANRSLRFIETGFPIEQVSEAAGKEKSIRQGHISTLQMWWARRPMGVCRAALFAGLCPAADVIESIPDLVSKLSFIPGNSIDEKLHHICAALADWQGGTDKQLLEIATALISSDGARTPSVLDTFAGGGSIPIEAVRLGLQAFASDLNPVAVVPLKLALEMLPETSLSNLDIYDRLGQEIGERLRRLGTTLYGDTDSIRHLAVFWCKTITCPDCKREVPLLKDKWLAKDPRRCAVRLRYKRKLGFEVYSPSNSQELADADSGNVTASGGRCPWCKTTLSTSALAELSRTGRMRDIPYAKLVLEDGKKTYKDISSKDIRSAAHPILRRKSDRQVKQVPDVDLDINGIRHTWAMQYGIKTTRDLYSSRQQVALLELFYEIERVLGGVNHEAAQLCRLLLTQTFNRMVMYGTRHAWWQANGEFPANMYVRQGIPMVWNFVEIPVSSSTGGGWHSACTWIKKVSEHLAALPGHGKAWLGDAAATELPSQSIDLVAIDPPYFDSITYGYLADPFYVWMKLFLNKQFPEEFAREQAAKDEEAIVDRPHKLAPSPKTSGHFRRKMEQAFKEAARVLKPGGRLLVMYGHKKLEAWDVLLSALLDSGFVPTVSWPVQMERKVKFKHGHIDALASSCIIFCERSETTEKRDASWEEVQSEFRSTIRRALFRYQRANFMGTDLASALIAPAAALLHKYSIRDSAGRPWRVSKLLEQLPRIAEECETEAIEEQGAQNAGEILSALRSISLDELLGAGKRPGWTAHAGIHSAISVAARYAEALYQGKKIEADELWNELTDAERTNLCMALRAAALISPPGSLGRQLAHAGLGRASMLLRVN